MEPLLSIVITTWNSQRTIKKLLDSLPQPSESLEIIVVDDHSSDNTLNLIPNTVKKYRLDRHSGNPGIVRNAGTDMAQGTWIWHLDSDDYLCSDLTNLLTCLNDSTADITYLPRFFIDQEEVNMPLIKGEKNRLVQNTLENTVNSAIWSYICKKHVFTAFPFCEGTFEDYQFMLRILSSDYLIESYDQPLYVHTINDSSFSKKKDITRGTKALITIAKTIQEITFDFLTRHKLWSTVCRGIIGAEILPIFLDNFSKAMLEMDSMPLSLQILYSIVLGMDAEIVETARRDPHFG